MSTPLELVTVAAHGGLAVAVGESVRRGDVGALVNAGGGFVLSVLPWVAGWTVLEGGVDPALPLWVAVAGLLHAVGMLELYEAVGWWDHLTHAVSAALVAALTLAGLVAGARDGTAPALSPLLLDAAVVGVTLVVGVCWELVEVAARRVGDAVGVEPLLVYYGRADTALDLVFDLVGALAVVALDVRVFTPVIERAPATAGGVTTAALGAVVVLTLGLAGLLWLVGGEWLPAEGRR